MQAKIAAVKAAPEKWPATSGAPARRDSVESLLARNLSLDWAPCRWSYDDPVKTQGKAETRDLMLTRLTEAVGKPEKNIDIGLVVHGSGKESGRRPCVRIPNAACGYASSPTRWRRPTSVWCAGTKRRRRSLRCGAEIYELKPDATDLPEVGQTNRKYRRFGGSSTASLHAKTFSIDRNRIFVGSFNADLRSIKLNTEMGLVIESPTLAGEVSKAMDRAGDEAAYKVTFASSRYASSGSSRPRRVRSVTPTNRRRASSSACS
jgi:putative cardiolipin synthase